MAKIHWRSVEKRSSSPRQSWWCDHSPRARYPGMWSQVDLRKDHYEKASGGDRIPVELFQILKDAAAKVLHSICQQIWKTQQWPKDWRWSVFIWISKRGIAKDIQTTTGFHSFHMLAKCCSKFSKPDFNSTWTENLQIFKLDLEKPEKTRDQIASIC